MIKNDEKFRLECDEKYAYLKRWSGFFESLFLMTREDSIYYTHLIDYLDIIIKITDYEYLSKLIEGKIEKNTIVFKVNKIYSFDLKSSENNIEIICDSLNMLNKQEYKKVVIKLPIFDEIINDSKNELTDYLKQYSLKENVSAEEKYEKSIEYKKRKNDLIINSIVSIVIMILGIFLIYILLTIINNNKNNETVDSEKHKTFDYNIKTEL